jgi:hypothetical protein
MMRIFGLMGEFMRRWGGMGEDYNLCKKNPNNKQKLDSSV